MLTRLASRSAARPKRTLAVVALFLVVAGLFGGPVAGQLGNDDAFTTADAESARAERQIERATGQSADAGIVLLVRGGDARASAAADTLRGVDGIAAVGKPVPSRTGDSALVSARTRASADDGDVVAATEDAFAQTPGVTVGGPAVATEQIGSTVSEDLGRAELLAFPLLALLSLLFFRGRATLLPVVVGVTTVLGTFLVLLGVNQLYGLSIFALNLVIGLGLGLAIDYTLFLVTRFREELSHGASTADAVRTTMRTAGRTVAFSAATVAAALATLTIFPLNFAQSMGIAGATVAIVAALASLLITPALFGLWGAKLLRRKDTNAAAAHDRWHRLAHAVMRRPGVVAIGTAAVMLAVALPATGAKWTPVDGNVVPTDKSARVVSDAIERDFGGTGRTPVGILVDGADRAAVTDLARTVRGLEGVTQVSPPQRIGTDRWTLTAAVPGDPAGERARAVVHEVRDLRTPLDTLVAGPAAAFVDQQATIGAYLLPAILILAGLTFAVLWLMTGSVILPLKAIAMNALTVGAALSPLVLIYQGGHLEGLLGYTSSGGVEPTDFLVTAAIVFALSTDYGVFLLGRIKEARDDGATEREAVATGVARTGRVVTAAAVLLAVAIGAFSTSSISFIQQIGIATATGVLLDAFVVRTFLVPSLMALLGKWNWWAPRPLRRLHARVGVSEAAPSA